MTLTEFLLARIAEDEALAHFIIGGDHWHGIGVNSATEVATHITRQRPTRVLAECEAKRRIVDAHAYIDHAWFPDANKIGDVPPMGNCWECSKRPGPCPTIRALALPYADHPDYREEWALPTRRE